MVSTDGGHVSLVLVALTMATVSSVWGFSSATAACDKEGAVDN